MSSPVLKHIAEEKDIARYKITLLGKGTKKQYKERLLSIEKDFIEYPFEKIVASTVEELREAMELFRADRHTFYEKYEKKPLAGKRVVTESQLSRLREQREFYKSMYERILDFDIKEVNLIQNDYIKKQFGEKPLDPSSCGIDSILEAEGASFAKSRARIQILLYCLARYMHGKVKGIGSKISSGLTPCEYDEVKGELDSFFKNYLDLLFKHYNEGIVQVPMIINGTLGHNSFVATIYPLSNLIDKYDYEFCLERVLDGNKPFFSRGGKPVNKKFVKRGFCVKTPMRRIGNESICLLYRDLWTESGIRITSIFESEFFSIKDSDLYYKAVSTKPVWEWPKLIDNPYLSREILGFLGISEPLSTDLDLSDKSTLASIEKCGKEVLSIDRSSSKIMIAATRSESDHIEKAMKYISIVVARAEEDFRTKFKTV